MTSTATFCDASQPHRSANIGRATARLTVFCDFDGPLMDVSDRYYATYRCALSEIERRSKVSVHPIQATPLAKDQFWRMKQDRIADAEIALHSGLDRSQVGEFMEFVQSIVNNEELLERDRLQPGVVWALNLMHRQGIQLVLVTLRCREQAIRVLKRNNLLHFFDGIWGMQDVKAAYQNNAQHKADLLKAAMHATLPEFNNPLAPPMVTCMIGDTEADIVAGQVAGIPTIALTCGIRSQAYLERYNPTQVHHSLLSATQALLGQVSPMQQRPSSCC